jgi:hypothetical protein
MALTLADLHDGLALVAPDAEPGEETFVMTAGSHWACRNCGGRTPLMLVETSPSPLPRVVLCTDHMVVEDLVIAG